MRLTMSYSDLCSRKRKILLHVWLNDRLYLAPKARHRAKDTDMEENKKPNKQTNCMIRMHTRHERAR